MTVRDSSPIEVFRPSEGDSEFLSVTTAVGMLRNEALATWGAQEVAKAAVRLAGSLQQRIREEGAAPVARWLAGKRFEVSSHNRTGRAIGTDFHDAAFHFALHETLPELDDEIAAYAGSFVSWVRRTGAIFLAAELTVFNLDFRWAGTLDSMLELPERGIGIVDWKTGRKAETRSGGATGPFAEVAKQLEGYANATHMAWDFHPRRITKDGSRIYLLSEEERARLVPMQRIDWTGVVHVTPRHAHCYEVVPHLRQREFATFLHLLDIAQAELGEDPIGHVIGEPVAA